MIASHYDLLAALKKAQQSGALAHEIQYPLQQAFRKANMKGDQITSLPALKAALPAWAFAKVEAALAA